MKKMNATFSLIYFLHPTHKAYSEGCRQSALRPWHCNGIIALTTRAYVGFLHQSLNP
jgi:hypothetical protein